MDSTGFEIKQIPSFLGARAPLELVHVKKKLTKKLELVKSSNIAM